MKPTLIFDMDGTIIDTSKSYCRILVECYEHFTGQKIDYDIDVKPVKHMGGYNNDWDLLMYLFEKNGFKVEYKSLQDYYAEHYCNENFEGYINIEEAILDRNYLADLAKDYNLTVFTGRYEHEAKYTLKRLNILDLFTQIIGYEHVGDGFQKPNPKGVNIIKSNVSSNKIYYMGDTVDDMLAAKSGGVIGVGCLPPQDKSQTLVDCMKRAGAYTVLTNIYELKDFLIKDLATVNQ